MVDCIPGDYIEGNCSTTCGKGIATDVRQILEHAQYGGRECYPMEKNRTCVADDCGK